MVVFMELKHNSAKTFGELEQELLDRETKLLEFKEALQRIQAEFENFSKRIEKEKHYFREFSNAETLKEFLPLSDSFDSAIKKLHESKSETISKKDAIEGIELLHKQFQSVLQKAGVSEIKSAGEKFNPEFHEALMQEKNPAKSDGIVLEELQKGFLLKGKVLRTSKVKVNKLD